MRTLIVNNIVSLDGFYSDAAGNPLALDMDGAFDRANLESITAADVVLLGRDSFDGFSSYWPLIANAPEPADPDAPEARTLDETNRTISRHYNRLPKVVVSDRGPIPTENAWYQTTTVIPRAGVAAWLAEAKAAGDGSIVVFASHHTWNPLLAQGLIDELHLMVSPVALGTGTPLFTEPARLELIGVRRFEDSSNVQLRYQPANAPRGSIS